MMKPHEAVQLILDEGLAPDGIVVRLRMGDDPGAERMARLIAALRTVFDDLAGAETLDRQLAYALFALACHGESPVESWGRQGRSWRSELVEMELPTLLLAVESVLSGEWIDLDSDA